MDGDRGFRVQQKKEYAGTTVCRSFLLQKLSSHPILLASPRPHGEIRRVQRGLSERISRFSLGQRTVVTSLLGWEITAVRAVELRSGYRLQATAEASAEAAFPVPPRRAHDTLQSPDESIIVGYYTSTEVLPRGSRNQK